jgi:mannose-6-phosphate isomerase-like protein (cupin superfamily)
MKTYFIAIFVVCLAASSQQPSENRTLLVGDGPPQFAAKPRLFISSKEIQDRIAEDNALVAAGKMTNGEPLVMQGPFRATMEWRNTAQRHVNLHKTDAEMFVVLEGSGTLLLGGILVNPKAAHSFPWEGPTLTAATVNGAKEYPVSKGDMILIPPNTPHTVSKVNGKLVLWSMHMPMPGSPPNPAAAAIMQP